MRELKKGTDLILKRAIKFRCGACGELFEALNTEYTLKNELKSGYSMNYAEATCPYCSGKVYVDVDDNGFAIPPIHDAKEKEVNP